MPLVKSTSQPRYRWNSKNKRVKISPARSRAMKIVSQPLKNKKRPPSVVAKIAKALKLTYARKRTVSGRRLAPRKKKAK